MSCAYQIDFTSITYTVLNIEWKWSKIEWKWSKIEWKWSKIEWKWSESNGNGQKSNRLEAGYQMVCKQDQIYLCNIECICAIYRT